MSPLEGSPAEKEADRLVEEAVRIAVEHLRREYPDLPPDEPLEAIVLAALGLDLLAQAVRDAPAKVAVFLASRPGAVISAGLGSTLQAIAIQEARLPDGSTVYSATCPGCGEGASDKDRSKIEHWADHHLIAPGPEPHQA